MSGSVQKDVDDDDEAAYDDDEEDVDDDDDEDPCDVALMDTNEPGAGGGIAL